MPTVINRNSHRVSSGNYKLSAGQVKEVSGEEADALTNINGVESASQEDQDSYNERRAGVQAGGSGQLRHVTALAAEARLRHRTLLVTIPLQTVIGDDAAPYGPDTGTITTKQVLSKGSEEDRRRFAPGERLPGEEENENLNDVERDQAAALTQLEELQAEVEERAQDEETERADEAGEAPAETSSPRRRRQKQPDEQQQQPPQE